MFLKKGTILPIFFSRYSRRRDSSIYISVKALVKSAGRKKCPSTFIEKGAAIGCNDRKCRHSYHLKCAHSDGAIFATVRHLLEETSTFLSLKRSINEKTILQSILLICIIFFYKSVMAQVRRALQTYCDVLPTIALLSGQWNSFSLAYKFLRPHLRSFFRWELLLLLEGKNPFDFLLLT